MHSFLLSSLFLSIYLPGHACVQDAEGNLYEGSFSDWKKHGKGKIQTVTGEQYEGEWVDGVRQGFGTLIRPDGSRFEGVFDKSKCGAVDTFVVIVLYYVYLEINDSVSFGQ